MPNRNEQGCPKLIYRIDARPPEEIFETGFVPWGSNTNFFRHILGYSIGDDIPEERRSGIISASDSPDSSLRFFGGMMTDPTDQMEYYLYEIRADETVYSASRTANFYNQRINNGLMDLEEGNLETAIDAIDSVFREFAYQREWFSVGAIPRERVRSAWRVDAVPINPNAIRHQRDTVYFTPRINDPEIFNPHYVDANTFANNLPFMDGATWDTPSRTSVPENVTEADASGGVAASMGFACTITPRSPHSPRSKREVGDKGIFCYYDSKKVSYLLKDKKPIKPVILSDVFPQKLYLRGDQTNRDFILSFKNEGGINKAILVDVNQSGFIPDFIFDSFRCLSWKDTQTGISHALSLLKTNFQIFYDATYSIATTNDATQKWSLKLAKIDYKNNVAQFRIQSTFIKGLCLKRNISTNELTFRFIDDKDRNFEEVLIVVTEKRCDSCIILTQNANMRLMDLGLSWFYQSATYSPIPETNRSYNSLPIKNSFFYDLNSYKILYINKNGKVFALCNERNGYAWNWISWVPSDFSKTNDKRLKWYFQNDKYDAPSDINFRNIRSFDNNDWLRVVVSGVNWGSFYTTPLRSDFNSIALFRLLPEADI
ncbi:MAG: hypothetical protein HUJ42_02860 [Malacoplasma sp.]|nr:hypothetical protein [Malacoplasma sp.]